MSAIAAAVHRTCRSGNCCRSLRRETSTFLVFSFDQAEARLPVLPSMKDLFCRAELTRSRPRREELHEKGRGSSGSSAQLQRLAFRSGEAADRTLPHPHRLAPCREDKGAPPST